MSEKNHGICQKIQDIDFSWICDYLVNNENMEVSKLAPSVFVYKCILSILKHNPNIILVPPICADRVLHAHIIHTKRYLDDCMNIFGRFVHHTPQVYGTIEYWKNWEVSKVYLARYLTSNCRSNQCYHSVSLDLQPDNCYIFLQPTQAY